MSQGEGGGQPTKYKTSYPRQAYKLCLLGATDYDLAEFFEVCEATINNWKNDYPKFLESIKKGKMKADAEIADSLFQRAKGYTHPEEKIFQYEGEIIRAKTKKHYPPDTAAAIVWLRNRQKEKWPDTQKHEHSGPGGGPIAHKHDLENLPSDELRRIANGGEKGTSEKDAGEPPPS